MASLQSLPEHLIGVIYSLLPDAASKRAFFSSSHLVHASPTVLDQVNKLVVPVNQLHASSSGREPTLAFPKAAQLKELVFKSGPWPPGIFGFEEPDHGQLITSLLSPGDEGVRAKLQRVTHLTFDDVRIMKSDHEAEHLGRILCSLPCLQALTISGRTAIRSAFLHSLSKAASGLTLRELHCKWLDASLLQAVSCLHSLESLSFGSIPHGPPNNLPLHPLSRLSALRHLSINTEADYEAVGIGSLLPQLKHLSSLTMVSLSPPSLISVMPPSLQHLCLKHMNVLDFCKYLKRFAMGESPPSLRQLRIEALHFYDHLQDPFTFPRLVLLARQLGLAAASFLPALPPFPSLIIDSIDTSPGLYCAFQFLEPLPTVAQGLKAVITEPGDFGAHLQKPACIAPTDMTCLAKLCPNLEGLNLNNVIFEDLLASLSEIAEGFPCLSRCCVNLDIRRNSGYGSTFLAFFAALALNQGMRHPTVHVEAWFWTELMQGETLEEWAVEELNASAEQGVGELQRAWGQLSAMLPGKARDVVFTYRYHGL